MMAIALAAGCDVAKDPEEQSGPDQVRLGAVEVLISNTYIDNVNYVDGDMTDWKYFTVPTSGIVTLVIGFDNPDARAVVNIKDGTGQPKSRLEHRGEIRLEQTFRAEAGVYYLEIFAQESKTSYTLELTFEQGI
jgi:hypothetical protein